MLVDMEWGNVYVLIILVLFSGCVQEKAVKKVTDREGTVSIRFSHHGLREMRIEYRDVLVLETSQQSRHKILSSKTFQTTLSSEELRTTLISSLLQTMSSSQQSYANVAEPSLLSNETVSEQQSQQSQTTLATESSQSTLLSSQTTVLAQQPSQTALLAQHPSQTALSSQPSRTALSSQPSHTASKPEPSAQTNADLNAQNGFHDVTLRLVQVTDGKRLVQTVLQDGQIKDCSLSDDMRDVRNFLAQYHKPASKLISTSRKCLSETFPVNPSCISAWPIKGRASETGEKLQDLYVTEGSVENANTLLLQNVRSLGTSASYLHVMRQVRSCRKHNKQMRRRLMHEAAVTQSAGVDEIRSHGIPDLQVILDNQHSSRQKRDILTGWLIFPGTKWCGMGDIAEHLNDLGYDESLDSCCRDHDRCPHIIPRMTLRYNLFNYRLHTLSHCRCDRRFRKCLKNSTSPTAHMVGKIYFNVMGPQCFKFTRKKTCKRRNWYGLCKKYANVKTAYLWSQKYF